MKKLLLFLYFIFHLSIIDAQPPQAISYQAVARNNKGDLINNKNISLRFSIHDSSAIGTTVYSETHIATTNTLGLFNLNIGQGAAITGNFSLINWGNGSKFIQVEVYDSIESIFIDMGTQQMLSVPYALYAGRSSDSYSHYIGELFGGGVIFYLYKIAGVEHGLIVGLTDLGDFIQATTKPYSNISNIEIGITAQSHWDGFNNSLAIVSQAGHLNSAAQICLNYSYTDNMGTYNDWYLPAIDEMELLNLQTYIINKYNPSASLSYFSYWSSTEYLFGGTQAYTISFSTGNSVLVNKTSQGGIRPIRAF